MRVVQRVLSNKLSIYPSICLCLRVGRGVQRLEVGGECALWSELELRAVRRVERAPLGRVDGGVRRVALTLDRVVVDEQRRLRPPPG